MYEPGLLEQESGRYPFQVGHPAWAVVYGSVTTIHLSLTISFCCSASGDQQKRKRRVPGVHQPHLRGQPGVHRVEAAAEDEADGRATPGRAHSEGCHIRACRF